MQHSECLISLSNPCYHFKQNFQLANFKVDIVRGNLWVRISGVLLLIWLSNRMGSSYIDACLIWVKNLNCQSFNLINSNGLFCSCSFCKKIENIEQTFASHIFFQFNAHRATDTLYKRIYFLTRILYSCWGNPKRATETCIYSLFKWFKTYYIDAMHMHIYWTFVFTDAQRVHEDASKDLMF